MAPRLNLQTILEQVLGSRNVYFQPPENLKMSYPAIVYHLNDEWVRHADDMGYFRKKRYQITVVDRNPDSTIPDRVGSLPLCSFDRWYASNGLNHFVYNLYF
jgi:hypothetical protein|nr:MAG TPA: tail completion protein [Caudoviricetes sp.]